MMAMEKSLITLWSPPIITSHIIVYLLSQVSYLLMHCWLMMQGYLGKDRCQGMKKIDTSDMHPAGWTSVEGYIGIKRFTLGKFGKQYSQPVCWSSRWWQVMSSSASDTLPVLRRPLLLVDYRAINRKIIHPGKNRNSPVGPYFSGHLSRRTQKGFWRFTFCTRALLVHFYIRCHGGSPAVAAGSNKNS